MITNCTKLSRSQCRSLVAIDGNRISADEFYLRYVRSNVPIPILGAMDNWPALDKWRTLQYLVEKTGNVSHPVSNLDKGALDKTPLGIFWKGMFEQQYEAKAWYLSGVIWRNGAFGALGSLAPDVDVPAFMPKLRHQSTKVFAGLETVCSLHYHHRSEALLCQVVGERRILLFPPSDIRHLDAYPWYSDRITNSKIQFFGGDEWPSASHPAISRTAPFDIILQPGDILYIPIYWWHVVYGCLASICVTQFFLSAWRRRYLSYYGLRSNYRNLF